VKIASRYCQGKGFGPRIEMQEGLFLYRINVDDARIAVGNRVQLPRDVNLGLALSPIARHDGTLVRTGTTPDFPVAKPCIEVGLLDVTVCWRKTLVGPKIFPRKE